MAYSVIARNTALDAIGTAGNWCSLHTADPGATGASPTTASRVATTWSAAASGSKTGTAATIAVAAATTVNNFGVWSASTAGNFLAGGLLVDGSSNAAPETFTNPGTYAVTPTLYA